MHEHKEGDLDARGDQLIEDDDEAKRYPLVMVPIDNDYDPSFPAMLYRMGKYVTM